MRSLWFKQHYARDILNGQKRHTDRQHTHIQVGETVAATVGPRPPFALLRIIAIDPVPSNDPETAENRALYGDAPLVRIHFELVARYGFGHRHATSA